MCGGGERQVGSNRESNQVWRDYECGLINTLSHFRSACLLPRTLVVWTFYTSSHISTHFHTQVKANMKAELDEANKRMSELQV